MTAFFLPGSDATSEERDYGLLQDCAERTTGSRPTETRIQWLTCRLGGKDCTIEVGRAHPIDASQVVAILDLGRQLPYGVFTTADPDTPALLVRKRVYSVTEFR